MAAAVDYQRRQREGEFDAAGQRRFSILVSLPLGVGVGLALAAFGLGNRVLAGFIGRTLGRLLPGSDRLWSPIGRLTTLGILAGSIFGLVHTVYSIIESKSERIEPAFEDPPETKLVTSGAGSAIDWSTLGYKGRRYVASVNSRRQIEEAMQQPATDPVRVYIGLETASTPEERVRLALDELERTGRSRES